MVPTSKKGKDTITVKQDNFQKTEQAYLVAVDTGDQDALWTAQDSITELAALAKTAGASVAGTMIQRLPHPDSQTYVGKGRAQELSDLQKELEFDLLICDDELKPAQQRNLEKLLDVRVIDRTALILDIFAQHARTREGRLQVELAQAEYRLPRLMGHGVDLSRQAGGSRGGAIGVRGPGETKLEVDRRRVRDRITELKAAIEEVRQQRGLHRRQWAEQAMPVVAVVGYTNAGKSSLFNVLTAAKVLAENKLFATLDPVTRHIILPGNQEVLLTDTVGFIQKLPTKLIAAFRATLEEVIEADVLLEVVDASHPNASQQSETVDDILEELKALDKPRITALNKIDLLPNPSELDLDAYPNAVAVSALRQEGLDALRKKILEVLSANMDSIQVLLPYAKGDLVELFHRRGHIEQEEHKSEGISITGRLPRSLSGYYAAYAQP